METWLFILLLMAGSGCAVWLVIDFFGFARAFIAPDHADAERIERELGKNTPAARAAFGRRFGPGEHWRDACTALSGLLGMALVAWILFG